MHQGDPSIHSGRCFASDCFAALAMTMSVFFKGLKFTSLKTFSTFLKTASYGRGKNHLTLPG